MMKIKSPTIYNYSKIVTFVIAHFPVIMNSILNTKFNREI